MIWCPYPGVCWRDTWWLCARQWLSVIDGTRRIEMLQTNQEGNVQFVNLDPALQQQLLTASAAASTQQQTHCQAQGIVTSFMFIDARNVILSDCMTATDMKALMMTVWSLFKHVSTCQMHRVLTVCENNHLNTEMQQNVKITLHSFSQNLYDYATSIIC